MNTPMFFFFYIYLQDSILFGNFQKGMILNYILVKEVAVMTRFLLLLLFPNFSLKYLLLIDHKPNI